MHFVLIRLNIVFAQIIRTNWQLIKYKWRFYTRNRSSHEVTEDDIQNYPANRMNEKQTTRNSHSHGNYFV